jgi:hypothetical protein
MSESLRVIMKYVYDEMGLITDGCFCDDCFSLVSKVQGSFSVVYHVTYVQTQELPVSPRRTRCHNTYTLNTKVDLAEEMADDAESAQVPAFPNPRIFGCEGT